MFFQVQHHSGQVRGKDFVFEVESPERRTRRRMESALGSK